MVHTVGCRARPGIFFWALTFSGSNSALRDEGKKRMALKSKGEG
jgi:hypothetical protein